jgi:hypothetical protein
MTARSLVPCLAFVLFHSFAADAAVLCARQRPNATVRLRAACRPNEIEVTPEAVGFCCTVPPTTSSSTTVTSTTIMCPTTTTLGVPPCEGGAGCNFPCYDGRTCTDVGGGQCACTGPVLCGGTFHTCGGECPAGQLCTPFLVPPGCPITGCSCL